MNGLESISAKNIIAEFKEVDVVVVTASALKTIFLLPIEWKQGAYLTKSCNAEIRQAI